MGALAAISALVGIVGSIVGIVNGVKSSQQADNANSIANKNVENNQEIATKNFELSKEQFEYQKELNQTVMDREDTAFQRQVADLKAAGLSPLNIAGGSPATALTSANAPQFDMSGINQAVGNLIGAYNDSFNRQMSKNQFALQAKSQTAQLYTQLAENYRDQKQAELEYKYLDEKLKWEKKHGFRDLDWKSDLTQVIEDVLYGNRSSILPDLTNQLPSKGDIKSDLDNIINDIKTDRSRNNNSTAAQRSRDTAQLNSHLRKDYKENMDLLVSGTLDYDKFNKAAKYIYRYTDAWRDFETLEEFEAKLKQRSFRESLYEKYPFKSR